MKLPFVLIFLKILFFQTLLSSCQTNMARGIDEMQMGTDKSSVLEKLGSPRHMSRINGEDRWYYLYYKDEVPVKKEVHFRDGRVVYAGDKKSPPEGSSVEAIDAKNAKANEELDLATAKSQQNSKNAYAEYLRFERQLKKQDEVHYMPEFEPVR